jgi:phage shock protein PspC (stress-responsive transcriptional regulator)
MVREPPEPDPEGMETHDEEPTTPGPETPADDDAPTTEAPHEPPRRLYRSRTDRKIGGVCAGIADYFGIDPVIVRVIAVALTFAGGAGLLAYIAAWLLVPEEPVGGAAAAEASSGRVATVLGAILLICAFGALVTSWGGPFGGWFGPPAGAFFGLVVLGLAGLGIWWLASDGTPAGGPRDILRRAGLGLALLALCLLFAVAGAWATAAGGGGVVAAVTIVAGLWLVAGAFFGGARWLILPALALALPASAVAAAGVDVHGGVGDREYRPQTVAQVRSNYRLGVGRLVVDLRDAQLPPGDRRLHLDLGVGEAILAVPQDVCVVSDAQVRVGVAGVFDHTTGGFDVDWQDEPPALPGTPRLIVDADIGVGALYVGHDDPDKVRSESFRQHRDRNAACIGGRNG